MVLPVIYAAFSHTCRPRSSCDIYQATGEWHDIFWIPILGGIGILIAVALFLWGLRLAVAKKKYFNGTIFVLLGILIFVFRIWSRFQCEMDLCEPLEGESEQFGTYVDDYQQHP